MRYRGESFVSAIKCNMNTTIKRSAFADLFIVVLPGLQSIRLKILIYNDITNFVPYGKCVFAPYLHPVNKKGLPFWR